MAVIKYKDSKGNWADIPLPLTVLESAGGNTGGAVEYVEITGSTTSAAFPNLSPYIDDLSQIALMVWTDSADSTGADKRAVTTYIYCPMCSNYVQTKTINTMARSEVGSVSYVQIYSFQDSKERTLTGTAAELNMTNPTNGRVEPAKYVGVINLYYYNKEGA